MSLVPAYAGRCGLAAVLVVLGCNGLQTAIANGDTRTITLHHLHTGEDISITYKRDGKYDADSLKKLDWFVRDWRREESIKMDPRLYDLVWDVTRITGGEKPIQIVCGYRAPATNAMLRRRSRGVAQQSQHTVGHAMDFFIPDVDLSKLREAGLRLQRGGVGFYPTSGSPFVHLDTGNVRHWPRMTHDQLARVFPDGRTVHIPSDGVPLKNYALALADLEKHGSTPSLMSLDAARDAGIAVAARPQKGLLASLFGSKDDDDESETTSATPTAKPSQQSFQLASADTRTVTLPSAKPVPLPPTRPARPAAVQTLASLSFSQIIAARGSWDGAPPAKATTKSKVAAADIAPEPNTTSVIDVSWPIEQSNTTDRAPQALAYAAQPAKADVARPTSDAEQGAATTLIKKAAVRPTAKPVVTAAVNAAAAPASLDDPWIKAAMFAPDIHNFMNVTVLGGAPDVRSLAPLMQKPTSIVMSTFSNDPQLGTRTDRFTGVAVMFLPVIVPTTQTAALQ